jgi:GxxExxY protein
MTNQVLVGGDAKRDPRTYAIIGAGMEVHRHLGPGFLEAVYFEALEREMTLRGIPFQREMVLPVYYKGDLLRTGHRADFICYAEVLVEIKAMSRVGAIEQAQVLNYLRATGLKVGLLMNFGETSLYHKRYASQLG